MAVITRLLVSAASAAVLLSACSPETQPPAAPQPPAGPETPPTTPGTPPAQPAPDNGRVSRYTSLKSADCRTTESNIEEGGYVRQECPGLAGYGVQVVEADGRLNLLLRAPGAAEHVSLRLPEQSGGGFSRLGEQLEWRGEGEGAAFKPQAAIVRHMVVQDASEPSRETSNLMVISLGQGGPCLAQVVPPGADQNATARAAADGDLRCRPR